MKKRDIIVIVGILIVALVSFLLLRPKDDEEAVKGETAIVRINGEIVNIYPLDVDNEYVLNGGTHILVIKNGEAYMKQAVCFNQDCVIQGVVWENGKTITCLPYRLTVTISNEKMPSLDLELG